MFNEQQIKMILQGFAEYHAKLGAKSIIRETSPKKGYYIDGAFYSDDSILKPFKDRYQEVKKDKNIC